MSDAVVTPRNGRVITFYSYKGGTGRSMALANMAWLLAASDKKVLIIDWDLEAPGIHRYFKPFLIDEELASSEGLIDLVWEFVEAAVSPDEPDSKRPEKWYEQYTDCRPYTVSVNTASLLKGGQIDLMPAGKQGPAYATRINLFDWGRFYSTLGGGRFLEALRDRVRAEYDYVLIDSRTGVSDTSGICTVQLPDALVVCFTYNNQSIKGASAIAQSAVAARTQLDAKLVSESRAQSPAMSPTIFPVPTRVDQTEQDKLESRRRYARAVFDPLLAHIPATKRNTYWVDVEIPHIPYFAYEEIVAPFRENAADPKSALAATARLLAWIESGVTPDPSRLLLALEQDAVRRAYAATPYDAVAPTPGTTGSETFAQKAERYFNGLPLDGQLAVRSILLNLIGWRQEGTREGPYRLQQLLDSLPARSRANIDGLREAGAIRQIDGEQGQAPVIEIADDSLLKDWTRIQDVFSQNLVYLKWREGFRSHFEFWARSSESDRSNSLLRGAALEESEGWLRRQPDDLNQGEKDFILASMRAAQASLALPPSARDRGHVFILRPFGVQEGIDFDEIEYKLLQPALQSAGLHGSSAPIFAAGNIREDIFGLLITADLVIADVSIHNASVFYELGLRHGLRPRATLMLRAQNIGAGTRQPFDLQSERYFVYDQKNLGEHVDRLAAMLNTLLATEHIDSPIYTLLPDLKAPDVSKFISVPVQFREDLDRARKDSRRGDLRLLAYEASWFTWASEGLRFVGRAQLRSLANRGAQDTFEQLHSLMPKDVECNQRLATVYLRFGDVQRANQAVDRLIEAAQDNRSQLAEALALRARNLQWQWFELATQKSVGGDQAALRTAAFRLPQLAAAQQSYAEAYALDLNNIYPGIMALTLLCIRIELARALPEDWADQHDGDEDASRQLQLAQNDFEQLAVAVRVAMRPMRGSGKEWQGDSMWLMICQANLELLTDDRPARVARKYVAALSGAPPSAVENEVRNLRIFEQLGVRADFADAALVAIESLPGAKSPTPEVTPRVLLFVGTLLDVPRRRTPRFPNTVHAVAEARRMIHAAVLAEQKNSDTPLVGFASAACGGDVLFHEVCAELGIKSEVYLGVPPDRFVKSAVQIGGPSWLERFASLIARVPPRVLAKDGDLPPWLQDKPGYDIWQRANLWMMFNALERSESQLTLITMGNAKTDDGPGGSAELVGYVRSRGFRSITLPIDSLAKQRAS